MHGVWVRTVSGMPRPRIIGSAVSVLDVAIRTRYLHILDYRILNDNLILPVEKTHHEFWSVVSPVVDSMLYSLSS